MRTLIKNKRTYEYALPIGTKEILDEYGNTTLEYETEYSDRITAKVNYSSGTGEDVTRAFGSATEYSRLMMFGKDCPLVEGALVWINEVEYKVVRIADNLNSTLVQIDETNHD